MTEPSGCRLRADRAGLIDAVEIDQKAITAIKRFLSDLPSFAGRTGVIPEARSRIYVGQYQLSNWPTSY